MAHKFTDAEQWVVYQTSSFAHMVLRQDWFNDLPDELKQKLRDAFFAYHELFVIAHKGNDDA